MVKNFWFQLGLKGSLKFFNWKVGLETHHYNNLFKTSILIKKICPEIMSKGNTEYTEKKNLHQTVCLFLRNALEFQKLQNVWSIKWIGVFSEYKSLGLIDEKSTRGHRKKLSVSTVKIFNAKVCLVTFCCKDILKHCK